MAQEEHKESDHLSEKWLNDFEEECIEELENEPNMEDNLCTERECAVQKLWLQFQNSATAIAELYKDRHHGLSLWIPFQNAATSVTNLYKDSVDTLRRNVEIGASCGRQRKIHDVVAWAKKRKRHIRREDLIGFLCGKSPPPRNRHQSNVVRHLPSPRLGLERHLPSPRLGLERIHSPRLSEQPARESNVEPDLQAFREALALQGLNGAMSNVSVGFSRPHGGTSPQSVNRNRNNMEELSRFILDEFSRNYDARKRTSSPDVIIDSPSRKRSRLM